MIINYLINRQIWNNSVEIKNQHWLLKHFFEKNLFLYLKNENLSIYHDDLFIYLHHVII